MDANEQVHAVFDEAAQRTKRERQEKANGNGAGAADNAVRFKLTPFKDIKLKTGNNYLVKGLIPREGLVVIWGPPKCGKSFWTLDLVLHVALDWNYRDRQVTAGPVVYVACEGELGLGARIEAFRLSWLADQTDEVAFHLVTTRLDLVADHRRLIDDIRAQVGPVAPVAVVIDTLNRSLAGSESKDEDMSAYIKAADAIREAFKCTVLIIHHCGVEGTRPRGHTSLAGAADAQIAVKRDAAGLVIATVDFMKDGAEGAEIRSRLVVVEVEGDKDGNAITSCCITPAESEQMDSRARPKRIPKLTDRQIIAKQAIVNFFAAGGGGEAPPSTNVPKSRKAALRPTIVEVLGNAAVAKEVAESKRRREAIGRILESLQSRGIIGAFGDYVWLAE